MNNVKLHYTRKYTRQLTVWNYNSQETTLDNEQRETTLTILNVEQSESTLDKKHQ